MVMIMTRMAGNSCLMAAVAANPSMPGMRTSIRSRSGCTLRHSARASPASTASAITARSCWWASIARSPSRASAWSSTIMMRAGTGALGTMCTSVRCRQRHLDQHAGACARPALHRALPPQPGHALLNAGQTHPLAGPATGHDRLWHEAPAPVLHGQAHDLPGTLQPDPGLPAVRMFTHVRQRLLGHAKERGLHGQREALGAERLIVADLPALATQLVHLHRDRRCEPKIVEDRGPEIRHDVPCLLDRGTCQLHRPAQLGAGVWRARTKMLGKGFQALVGA